jgi:hypothetical protein
MNKFTKFQEFLEPLETSLEFSSDFYVYWYTSESTENKISFLHHAFWKAVNDHIDKELVEIKYG